MGEIIHYQKEGEGIPPFQKGRVFPYTKVQNLTPREEKVLLFQHLPPIFFIAKVWGMRTICVGVIDLESDYGKKQSIFAAFKKIKNI